MNYATDSSIGDLRVSLDAPTVFIADVASNHDGDLSRAKELIWAAAASGANVVKFQHFIAENIVSDYGFRELGSLSHQATWSKPVYEVYEQYELSREWTEALAKEANRAAIPFMTTPYDFQAVEHVKSLVPAYKIGSGDVTWTQMIDLVARQGKPVLLATGASELDEVKRAVEVVLNRNRDLVLMQCNTNYTGDENNFAYVNLRVLDTFAKLWPGLPLGLSDHTPGHAAVLGAVALGARVVEKHFTDDTSRAGPDHSFSLDGDSWGEMVVRTRELEAALGDGVKRLEPNETETVTVQRRALRYKRDLPAGSTVMEEDLEALRPAGPGLLSPDDLSSAVGHALVVDVTRGEGLRPEHWDGAGG